MSLSDKRRAYLEQQKEQVAQAKLRKENLQKLPETAKVTLPISPEGVESGATKAPAKKKSRAKKKNTVSVSEEVETTIDVEEGEDDSGEKDAAEMTEAGVQARSGQDATRSLAGGKRTAEGQSPDVATQSRGTKRSRTEPVSSPSRRSQESDDEIFEWMKPGFQVPLDPDSLRKISGEMRNVAVSKICDPSASSDDGETLLSLKTFLHRCAVEDSRRVVSTFDVFEERLNKESSDVAAWENAVNRERGEKMKVVQELKDLEAKKKEVDDKYVKLKQAGAALKPKFEALVVENGTLKTENEKLKADVAEMEALKKENEELKSRLLTEEASRKSLEAANLDLKNKADTVIEDYKASPQFKDDAETETYDLLQRCTLISARHALGDGAPVDKVVEWVSAHMYGDLAKRGASQIPFDTRELGELAKFDEEMGNPVWEEPELAEENAFIKYLDRSSQIEEEIAAKKAEVAKTRASSI